MSNPFRYYIRVRYAECDAQKVVFNARYGDYVDLAATEFFRLLGFREELLNGEFDYQVVRQVTEWKAPARFDQVLELSVQAMHLGNTSFTLATEFRIAGEPAVIARAETVYVTVDPRALTKKPIPDPIRAGMEQGAEGRWVDHAGFVSLGAA
jgi:acyl-CoA thioester hydrolase